LATTVRFLVLLEFASGLLQGWMSPLLPSIVQHYDITAADANWVTAVYLLSSAVCVPLMSKLGDRYGHRRLLIAATTLVAVGSVVVAVAPTFGLLLLGRAVQGPLGAFLALEFAIVRERAGDRAGRAIGLLVGSLAIGGSVGLFLAGVIRESLSLTATLWLPAVVMIAMVPVVALLVPETTVRTPGRIDWTGAGLLSVGLLLLIGAVGNGGVWGWGGVRTVGALVGGLVALAVWLLVERRVAHPFVDLTVVLRRGLALPMLAGLWLGAELFGSTAASALFLGLPTSTGYGLGRTAGQIGFILLAFGAAAFVGTWLAPRLAERIGARRGLLLGSLLTAGGYLLTALAHGSVTQFAIWQVLVGSGNGLVLATLSTAVVTHAAAGAVAISSGMFNTVRTVGGAVSGAAFVAVMGAFVTRVPGTATTTTSETGYVTVWLICAALALAVFVTVTRMERRSDGQAGRNGGPG
jgi:MFS family permease